MYDSVGGEEQEKTNSACATEDEDHASTTGDDDEGTRSEGFSKVGKENVIEKIEFLETTNSTGENGDERQILVSVSGGGSDEELPRRDKGKERARIEEQEESRSENMQDTSSCSYCTEPIRESPLYVIYHIQDPQTMEHGYPVCSPCLRELQTTHTFQPYAGSMASISENDIQADSSKVPPLPQHLPQLDPITSQSASCPEHQPLATSRPNPQGRRRVCQSLSSRRERWRAKRIAVRERSRQLRGDAERKFLEKMGRSRRISRIFGQERLGRSPQSSGVAEQGFAGRIRTRTLETSNNRLRRKVSYTSRKREIRSLKMLLRRARARLVHIRGQRAVVPVPHHTPVDEPFPPPLTPSSLSPSHLQSPLRAAQGQNPILELESSSISTPRPVYMGPPPSEAGPSNLNRIARPRTYSQVYSGPQSPVRVARPDNPFFRSPETCPSQTIWRDDEYDKMQE